MSTYNPSCATCTSRPSEAFRSFSSAFFAWCSNSSEQPTSKVRTGLRARHTSRASRMERGVLWDRDSYSESSINKSIVPTLSMRCHRGGVETVEAGGVKTETGGWHEGGTEHTSSIEEDTSRGAVAEMVRQSGGYNSVNRRGGLCVVFIPTPRAAWRW